MHPSRGPARRGRLASQRDGACRRRNVPMSSRTRTPVARNVGRYSRDSAPQRIQRPVTSARGGRGAHVALGQRVAIFGRAGERAGLGHGRPTLREVREWLPGASIRSRPDER